MIQPNELRVNNKVHINGELFTVLTIEHITVKVQEGLNNYFIKGFHNRDFEFTSRPDAKDKQFIDITPIDLNKEWLLRSGFEHRAFDFVHPKLGGLSFIDRDSHFSVVIPDKVNLTSIKYLHQLQNFYHSITGEELNLQP